MHCSHFSWVAVRGIPLRLPPLPALLPSLLQLQQWQASPAHLRLCTLLQQAAAPATDLALAAFDAQQVMREMMMTPAMASTCPVAGGGRKCPVVERQLVTMAAAHTPATLLHVFSSRSSQQRPLMQTLVNPTPSSFLQASCPATQLIQRTNRMVTRAEVAGYQLQACAVALRHHTSLPSADTLALRHCS